ncbi:TonB-dependent receptor [Hyphomonas jannaschiana]|uniref:Outer membrane protein, TonB-dependent receptor n=1 Tax=Hyphomonas jannaschiana VP2 TaxID=1280952 RepID=A0A059FDI2_9PROT|nr:TonB-dependent receptor [Hyphomonas jannaschiana]KCZ88657.1 outer membrane protein, TonB-dependent receptor [Hyphomonas jannaschiana VP2]
MSLALILAASTFIAEPEDAPARLDPVVTTATAGQTPLSEIPMSVSVIGGEELGLASAYLGAEDVTDLLTGVEAAVANGTQVAFQIRGIGAVDHQALTPGAAAVYSDGVLLATNVQTGLMLYDLSGIEVLKGPQGTLFGRNASSGAISFLTARPEDGQSRYLRAGFGNLKRTDVEGAYGQTSGGFSYRLAGRYLSRDAALDNTGGPDAAGGIRDEFGLRLGLSSEDTLGGSLLIRTHYEEDNGVNAAPRNDTLGLSDHDISVGSDGIQDTDNEFYGTSAEYVRDIGEWTLTSLTAFEGFNQSYGFDFDGGVALFGNPLFNANLSYDRNFRQYSQEIRLKTERTRGSTLFGIYAAAEDFSQTYTIWCGELDPDTLLGTCPYVGAASRAGPAPVSDGTAMTLITDIRQERSVLAAFTYNEVSLTDRLTATLGARITQETIEGAGAGRHIFDDGTVGYNNVGGLGLAAGANDIEDTKLTGNVALAYETGAGTAYVSVANSYKSGGFNGEVQNNATHFSDEGLFDAETVTAYETGFKSEPSSRFIWNAALFWQDYDAPQARIFVNFPLPDGSSITSNSLSNLDAATVYGLDADMRWQATDALSLQGGLTLLDTQIDQTSDIGGNAGKFDGNPLPFAPDVSATLGGRYDFILPSNAEGHVSLHAKYRSRYYLDPEGLASRMQKGFTTLQAEAGLRFANPGIDVTLWARNLTDEDYALSGYGFIGYDTFRSDPRTYGVRIGYTF